MSITATPQVPNEMRFGISQQTALGTAVADNGAFLELSCDPFEINYGVKQINVQSSHGKRYQTDNDIVTHQKGVMPSFTISGICNADSLDYFLNAFTQNVTEATSTPYLKIFTMHASQPNFAGISAIAHVGQLLTVILRDPASSKSVKLADCVAKSLTITIQAGEPAKYSCEFVSKNAPSFSSNPSGTWTKETSGKFFYPEDIDTVTIDSTGYHLTTLEVALSRDVLGIGQDGAGNFADYGLSLNQLGFKMKVVKDADFEALLTSWTTNAAIAINVSAGSGTTDNDLLFVLRGKMNADTGVQKVYDAIMNGEISGVLTEASGGTAPLTISLANAIDRAWTSA